MGVTLFLVSPLPFACWLCFHLGTSLLVLIGGSGGFFGGGISSGVLAAICGQERGALFSFTLLADGAGAGP